jgi:hypothetical protein
MAEAERRIEEARRTKAEVLDLGDLALSELPANLGDLLHLRDLYLGRVGLDAPGTVRHVARLAESSQNAESRRGFLRRA